MNINTKLSLGLIFAATLTACGGGGSSTATTAPVTPVQPTVPPAPTVIPSNLQTSVPPLTYAANSEEYVYVSALNQLRSAVGVGLLAQDMALDKASKNHLSYVTTHSKINGGTVDMSALDVKYNMPAFHIEDPALSGFTGVMSIDRARVAGYAPMFVGELGTYGNGGGAAEGFARLAAGIYHRQGLLVQGVRNVGAAVATDPNQTTVLELGTGTNGQSVASDFIGAYPSDKQTMVPLFAGAESPNPYTYLADGTSATLALNTSYPITVIVNASFALTVSSFTVTEDGQPTPLAAHVFTAATDARVYREVAHLVGDKPFKPNTKYIVSFAGSINGQPVTKNWTFTTAQNCIKFSQCS